jgi:hypothetical protein
MGILVKNVTGKEIVQMFDGNNYTFPAGGCIEFDDANVANWFVNKHSFPASPADGKPLKANLVVVQSSENPVAAKLEAPVVTEPAPIPNTFVPPVAGHVPREDPEFAGKRVRDAFSALPKDELIRLAQKHGVYKKHMDKPLMVEKLASIGVKPPTIQS